MRERLLYVVRHCAAVGQAPEAPLTAEGREQAGALADALAGAGIDRIVSSPFRRALDSAEPLARRLGLTVEVDERLAERVLGAGTVDWRAALRASFDDPDLSYEGGESGRVAMARGVAAVREVLCGEARRPAIVTHGNLLALILRYFDGRTGFDEWRALSNPDAFLIVGADEGTVVRRVWR